MCAYSCQWCGCARTQKAAAEARTATGLSGPPVLPATPSPDPEWNLPGGSRTVRGGGWGGGGQWGGPRERVLTSQHHPTTADEYSHTALAHQSCVFQGRAGGKKEWWSKYSMLWFPQYSINIPNFLAFRFKLSTKLIFHWSALSRNKLCWEDHCPRIYIPSKLSFSILMPSNRNDTIVYVFKKWKNYGINYVLRLKCAHPNTIL